MVNLEAPGLNLADLSVLQELLLPHPAASVDPKLVLRSGGLIPHPSPGLAPPPGGVCGTTPPRPAPPSPTPPPPPQVPLSVQELERPGGATQLGSPPRQQGGGSPVDIVNLAAEEIRKPLQKPDDDVKV